MENLNEILRDLNLDKQITLEEIPNIDLYMDQVIQLFENKFAESKRSDEEKVMTKTMINNYAKGKLFFPIKKKKYSKEHILLIALIYQLKGSLSINDIKTALGELNDHAEEGNANLEGFYESYLQIVGNNEERFRDELELRVTEVKEEMSSKSETKYMEQLLLITSLVNISNSYRKVAERLIDDLGKE